MQKGKRLLTIFLGFFLLQSAQAFSDPESDALHIDWMDVQVKPSDDFYTYANGTWQKENPIPKSYATWDNFTIMQQVMQTKLHQMLIELSRSKDNKPNSIEQKIGDFYFSAMNEYAINKEGITPLQPLFKRILAMKSIKDVQELLPELQMMGVNAVFGFSSMSDFKNSDKVIFIAAQDGLGLPNRDYYLNKDAQFEKIRVEYQKHVARMFILLGDTPSQADKNAAIVMAIETKLAQASLSPTQKRDPKSIYHMKNLAQLQKITPKFSWSTYLTTLNQPTDSPINLGMPKFFKAVNKLFTTLSVAEWQTYYRWHVIEAFAPYLSKPFVEEAFNLDKILTGTKQIRPRWQRVVTSINAALDFALGKLYVERHFSEADKIKVQEIINNIRQEFRQALINQHWMSASTREAALKKLDLMQDRVGYPEIWRDYSALKLNRGPYVLNIIRTRQFENQHELDKIGKPTERREWLISPQTVNAYYDPSMNNINMLAGILQPPFFDSNAPAAINYGSIGFVIGHEMTHGFDDKGSLFDGQGNLKNWWHKNDRKQFKIATDCIVKQFSQYKVGQLNVNGKLVVGEATADLGGLLLAYFAFKNSKDYKTAKTIKGFTPDQQFFLSAAHVWAGNIRPEQAANLITRDPHPPKIYRVNGTFANIPAFQKAFGLDNNSPMVKKDRCVIWQ